MVTLEKAKEYLQSQGINLPDFMLQSLVDDVNSIQECLDSHYPASKALAIQMYFRYQSFADRWKGALALLRGADKHGCANDLIPPDPTNTAFAGIWIGKGGCMCNGAK